MEQGETDSKIPDFGTTYGGYKRFNKFSPSDPLVSRIHRELKESLHKKHGLRIDNIKFPTGQALPESRRWDDGIQTTETVGGVSTLGLPSRASKSHIRKALNDLGPYDGRYLTLVGGKSAVKGEDEGESIIKEGAPVNVYE